MNTYAIGQGFAGAAQGFEKGLQSTNAIEQQGFNDRLAIQKFALQSQQVNQQMDFQKQNQDLQVQQLTMQVQQMKKDQVKNDVYNSLNGYMSDGNTRWLNNALQSNPDVSKLMGGVLRVDKLNPEEDAKILSSLGIEGTNPDTLKRFVKATFPDGSVQPVDIHGLAQATGAWKQMTDDRIGQMLKEAQVAFYGAKANTASAGPKDTADVQNAKYFGSISSKIAEGTATPEETSAYDAWLTKVGGSKAAMQEITNSASTKFPETYKSDFDITLADPGKDADYRAFARKLEDTEGGKKLTANIAANLKEGLGAVKNSATVLSSLVNNDNVSTSMVKEQINQVKAYLPESMRDMTDADLKDAEFRQAYLSTSAVFLKLQSGLTVSDKERETFEKSFGTLSKNTKVNMTGLKTKLDEVISTYEANKALEPALYNIKYAPTIRDFKSISSNIDNYVNEGTTPSSLSQEDKQKKLQAIWGK